MGLIQRFFFRSIGIMLSVFTPCLASVTPTSTILSISPSGAVAAGTVMTLSASVTSGGSAVTRGLVLFCNAAAAHCLDSAILGQAQLTASGAAATRLRLGDGVYSIRAEFQGTALLARSVSTAEPLTVTGLYPTVTTVTAAGASGVYTLTGTLTTSDLFLPTGTVSFVDANHGNAPLGSASVAGVGTVHGFVLQPASTPGAAGSAAVGDFNGDGIPDMAIADYNDSTAFLLMGNGDGTFTTKPLPAVGIDPFTIVAADFNGDGLLDLAVVNEVDSNVTILINHEDGTFSAATSPGVGSDPKGLVVGDFNGDGIPDLATANSGDNTVTVLLGHGDGTFTFGSSTGTGGFPWSLIAGDFNGDGLQDLAIANSDDSTVTILLGHGDGTFTTKSTPAVGNSPDWIAVGDFNGDGIPDLVTANYADYDDSTITILLGKGDGTFTVSSISSFGDGAQFVAVADMNHDGISDVVITNSTSLSVLLGNGDGTFALLPSSSALTTSCCALAVGDFNGDGVPDLASGNSSNTLTMNVFLAETDSTVKVSEPLDGGSYAIVATYSGDAHFAASSSLPLTLNVVAPATPLFAPAPGIYQWTQMVTISDATPGAILYFTLDGSNPTESSTRYTGPISVTWDGNIKAIAVAPTGSISPVAAARYTIDRPLPPPTFSLVSGTYPAPQTLTIADDPSYCDHATCLIYVTLDGSTPNTGSPQYTGPITLTTGTTTVKAIAASYHFMNSPEAIGHYTLH